MQKKVKIVIHKSIAGFYQPNIKSNGQEEPIGDWSGTITNATDDAETWVKNNIGTTQKLLIILIKDTI